MYLQGGNYSNLLKNCIYKLSYRRETCANGLNGKLQMNTPVNQRIAYSFKSKLSYKYLIFN